MISDSGKLWDADLCFLHNQLMGTNVRFQKYTRSLSEVDFESSRSSAKSESWKKTIDGAEPCYPHDNIVSSHLCDECMILISLSVCHMLLSIWWLIELTSECQNSELVPDTNISKQIVSKLWKILQLIQVPPTDSSWTWNFAKLLCHFVCQFTIFLNAFFEHVLPCRRTTQQFLPENFSILIIFQLLQQKILDSNTCLCSSILISFNLHSRWVHPICTWTRIDVCLSRVHFFLNFLPLGRHILLLSSRCVVVPRTSMRMDLAVHALIGMSQFGTSSFFTFRQNFPELSFTQESRGCPCKFGSIGTTGSSSFMLLVICVVEDVSIYLQILTLEFWAIREHPPFLFECTRQMLSHHSLIVLQWYPLYLLRSFVTQTSLVR